MDTTELNETQAAAVQEYQCVGCVNGPFPTCYKRGQQGVECSAHVAGTRIAGLGRIWLGLPKGFCRLGPNEHSRVWMHDTLTDEQFDMWNRPVWKHLNANGHTLVRVFVPRLNDSQVYIFLENCLDRIDCMEITAEQIENDMD